ncbi:unnamed protein product [Gongylonema pulchrum]|uniref:Uncharacterized protein n=1 Tax=Gongylonema pulchrum TaxID=637853 RepID=A0A183EW62_9BILA|nr:unnamed protein product [Gongylonema pulchrum]VDN44032.1 unnamed protein product [Gongylonema pulchrum]
MTLAGKSRFNSVSLSVFNGGHGQVIPIQETSNNRPWWSDLRKWLYIVYVVMFIFGAGTIIFTAVFLARFFRRRQVVEDYNAISSFGRRSAKIEETTSRTWI